MRGNIAIATTLCNSQGYVSHGYCGGVSRKQNLVRLIEERFNGRQADFARAIGRSSAVVWQYTSGHREMGEKLARHIEARLRLPSGWLDASGPDVSEPPPPPYLTERQRTLLELFSGLTAAQQESCLDELRAKARLNADLLAELLARGPSKTNH